MPHFIEKTLQRIDKLDHEHVRTIIHQLYCDHKRLEEVINSLPEGILVLDQQHKPLLHNRAARLLLPLRDQKEKEIWKLVRDKEIAAYLQKTLQTENEKDTTNISLEVGGSLRTLQFGIFPLVRMGKIIGNILRVVDISDKITKESRLYRAEQLASLATLTANVAHEIKNPLASISIYIQLIKRDIEKNFNQDDTTIIKQHLAIVEEEIVRLNATVVQFLFSMRPITLRMEEIDIHELLDDVITLFEPEIQAANVTLSTHYATEMPRIEVDKKYITQTIMNIIKNAIESIDAHNTMPTELHADVRTPASKIIDANTTGATPANIHTPAHGIIDITTSVAPEGIQLVIADNGAGIDPTHASRIFEPYFTTKDYGSGIGLTQVYKVIKEHRGDIRLTNNKHKGATCTITLPLPRTAQKLLKDKVPETHKQTEASKTRRTRQA